MNAAEIVNEAAHARANDSGNTGMGEDLDFIRDLMKPFEKQSIFCRAVLEYLYTLYGGARGGGKSRIIRWLALYICLFYSEKYKVDDAHVGIFCETFPELTSRQILKAKAEFPSDTNRVRGMSFGRWVGYEFILHKEFGAWRIRFMNLDRPQKYRSAEFAAQFVDELTMNTLETVEELWQSLRWPGVEHNPFAAGTNPGGLGHAWVKGIWLDRQMPQYMAYHPVDNPQGYKIEDFAYIPALPTDNPYNPERYIQRLHNLPEPRRSAMLLGDWDAFAGMFFPSYNKKKMDVDPFEIPEHWPVWMSIDPGWGGICSCSLNAIRPAELIKGGPAAGTVRRPVVFRLWTYYVEGRNSAEHAHYIRDMISNTQWVRGRLPELCYSGVDAFHRRERHMTGSDGQGGHENTMADEFEAVGLPLLKAAVSRGSRIPLLANMRQVIDQGRLRTFRGENEDFHNELSGLMSDKNEPEEIDGKGRDPKVKSHAIDECRYILWEVERDYVALLERNIVTGEDYDIDGDAEYQQWLRDELQAHAERSKRPDSLGGKWW